MSEVIGEEMNDIRVEGSQENQLIVVSGLCHLWPLALSVDPGSSKPRASRAVRVVGGEASPRHVDSFPGQAVLASDLGALALMLEDPPQEDLASALACFILSS